jgi:hypothetical protein
VPATEPQAKTYRDKTKRRSVTGERRANHQPGEYPVKRTILEVLAFAMLAFAMPAAGEDIGGWQEAKWGMTPDEVQKVLSYPTSVADLAKVCRGPCNEGTALEIEDYELNGQHFIVRFWFANPDMRLQAVSMYAKQLNKDNGSEAFTKMKNFLGTVYGSPASFALKHEDFIVTWGLQSTTITLYSNAADQITIVYEERTDKEGGKS